MICWNGRVRIWILAPNFTGCDFQWEETHKTEWSDLKLDTVASLASLLNLRLFFACPTRPLPQWDSRLSAFVVGLHPLPGQKHQNPNSKPYCYESCRIMARIWILMQKKQLIPSFGPLCPSVLQCNYFKSTLYACKLSDSRTKVYHIPARFLFEAFDDSNLYAIVRFVQTTKLNTVQKRTKWTPRRMQDLTLVWKL